MDIREFYERYFRTNNVTTDTRKITSGDIFIALKGENFDGNKFAQQALESGASVAVIDDNQYLENSLNLLLVEDSLKFLQHLANYHRKEIGIPIIGITGSNGKTTTKELMRSVLSQKFSCVATEGNLNNHIGVPLTLLGFNEKTEIGIVEMGANHVGEIEQLSRITEPDSGVITNIGKAHLEGFGGFEGVIKAKTELYRNLIARKKKIYVNANDDLLNSFLEHYSNTIYYPNNKYSIEILPDKSHIIFNLKMGGEVKPVRTQLFGSYNLPNLHCAIAIGIDMGLSIDEIANGIESYAPRNNRSESIEQNSNHFIFDCYNANPTSMYEAIEGFSQLQIANKIVILGGMKELGEYSSEEHTNLVRLVESKQFAQIFLIGPEFQSVESENMTKLNDINDLPDYLMPDSFRNTAVLIKGSRANKLEQIKKLWDIEA